MDEIIKAIDCSYTQYQVVEESEKILKEHGFSPLYEHEEWKIEKGGKYFVTRGGSAMVAFTVGGGEQKFKIVASHSDSPALKIKHSPVSGGQTKKLAVECYGGGIWRSFMDAPLKIAGRVVYKKNDEIVSKSVVSEQNFVIPSVAIHLNRKVNEGESVNPQIDLSALFSSTVGEEYFDTLCDGELIDFDLYLVNGVKAFRSGANDEYICARGLDDRACVFSSLYALIESRIGEGINAVYIADSEEIGSTSESGADGDFLQKTLYRIANLLTISGENLDKMLAKSFMVSADNAHAIHPNHPELSDTNGAVNLGGGIVIKYNGAGTYTSNSITGALFEEIMKKASVPVQRYHGRSDMRSGSTLGAISLRHVTIPSVDIGAPQLAMHSSIETMQASDIELIKKGLTAFFEANFSVKNNGYRLD